MMAYWHTLRCTSRDAQLYLLTSALFGFAIFGGIYTTLFNLYLLRLGYDAAFAGLINGTGQFAFGLSAVLIGLVGRRLSARRLLTAGLSLIMLGFGLIPLAEFLPAAPKTWIISTHIIAQLGIGLYFVIGGPFLMQVTSPIERNHVYAMSIALWPLSGFAGSLIGGLLPQLMANLLGATLNEPAPYRYPLWLATLLMLPAISAMYLARDIQPEGHHSAAGRLSAAPLWLIGGVALAVLLRVVGEGAVRTFFNIYLDVDLRLSTAQIGMLMGVAQLLAVPASMVMPPLAARWGNGLTYLLGTWAMMPSLLLIAFIPHWAAAGLGYMGLFAFIGLARPAIVAYQMAIVAPEWRTLMAGATTAAVGLGWAVASLGGGYLALEAGYSTLFITGALLTGLSAAVFWVAFRPTPPGGSRAGFLRQ
jgi:MFS family permease